MSTQFAMDNALSSTQIAEYEENGFLILRGVFPPSTCDAYRQRMIDLATGAETLQGFAIHEPYTRTFNQHLYDPACVQWMLHPRLRQPLETLVGGRVEGMQTMHFFRGSQHRHHQDQYYLPECLAVWIPFEDVSERNGTIFIEPGSHRRQLVTKENVPKPAQMDPMQHQHQVYFPAVEKIALESGIDPVLVEIEKGDICIFHGRTIHGGAMPSEPELSRHVLAAHYLPYNAEKWDRDWPRFSFDGSRRVRFINTEGQLITD